MSANPFKRFAFAGAAPASAPQRKRARREGSSERTQSQPQPSKSVHTSDPLKLALIKEEQQSDGVPHEEKPEHRHVDSEVAREEEEEAPDRRLALLMRLFKARETMIAPIDEYGTQACVAPRATDARNKRFHILVAALLSAQTKDQTTHAAMRRLHEQLASSEASSDGRDDSEGLTVAKVRVASEDALDSLISPVGFHRKKAQQLKRIAQTLHAECSSDVPRSYAELVKLPGIGPKIARVVLLLAWNQVDGLIVDTHVHRLADRLGWTAGGIPGARSKSGPQDVKTPEDTRKALEDWIPQEHWAKFSLAVVGFGQSVCTAVNPRCASCPLADLCPSAFRATNSIKAKT